MVNISYFIPWKVFHGNGLHLNLYYNGYSPAGYNYITANDMNGDGRQIVAHPEWRETNGVEGHIEVITENHDPQQS